MRKLRKWFSFYSVILQQFPNVDFKGSLTNAILHFKNSVYKTNDAMSPLGQSKHHSGPSLTCVQFGTMDSVKLEESEEKSN